MKKYRDHRTGMKVVEVSDLSFLRDRNHRYGWFRRHYKHHRLRRALKKAGKVIAAAWSGKLKTVSQIIGILVIILEPLWAGAYGNVMYASYAMMALMTFTTLWSGLDYLRAYLPVLDLNR